MVKIWITPLLASVPNKVAADAPFRISTLSIDSGLISSKREVDPPPPDPTNPPPNPPPLSTRIPSTITIGSFNWDKDALPRIRIWAPSPVKPPEGNATIPGSRPANRSENELIGNFSKLAVVIDPILLPNCFLATGAPVPVTTISSSSEAENDICKSWVTSEVPTLTFCESFEYPV